MNSSGTEFALRIALCDLIERLKRCEQKCSYLENCRNELIKEVMRLRLENEWISKRDQSFNDTNQLMINSNNSNYNSSYNNLVVRTVNDTKHEPKAVEYELSENNENINNGIESWEEITVRLLRDLRRDVTNGQVLNELEIRDELQQNSSLPIIDETEDSDGLNDEYQRHIDYTNNPIVNSSIHTINGSINVLNDKLLDKNMIIKNKKQIISQRKKLTPIARESNLCSFGDRNDTYLSHMSDSKKLDNIKNVFEKECETEIREMRKNSFPNSFQTNPIDNNDSEGINAFCSAVYDVKSDLNHVLQALTAQNEKLNRLKAKQLRNYFQRQINLDQTNHLTSNTLTLKNEQKYDNY